MARKQKDGLSYFPLDCGFFRDDDIIFLQSRHGSAGICVYLYVLCKVYEGKGYFWEYRGDDSVRMIARDLELKAGTVRSVMSYLVGSSLLTRIDIPGDSTRPGPITVITSAGIQSQYQRSTEDRGRKVQVTVDARIWLLRPEDTASHIKVTLFSHKSGINENKSGINENKSGIYPVNEIKENEIKGEGINKINNSDSSADADHSSPSATISRTALIKSTARSRIGDAAVNAFLAYINDLEEQEGREVDMSRIKGYCTQLVQLSDDPAERAEILRQSTRKHWKGMFPLKEEPTWKPQKKSPCGSFANFTQREYDYADLEARLLRANGYMDGEEESWEEIVNKIFLEASPAEKDSVNWDRSREFGRICYHDGRSMTADEWRENRGASITEVRIS